MAKGPPINPIEAQIAKVFRLHPKWTAKMVRNEIEEILRKDARGRGTPPPPPGWPGISAVQKVQATIRKRDREAAVDPQDGPWSLGTLNDYPIDNQDLPDVIEIWKERRHDITIRKAKWIARLLPLFKNIVNPYGLDEDSGWNLDRLADAYVLEEQVYESIDRYFDSRLLDDTVFDWASKPIEIDTHDPEASTIKVARQRLREIRTKERQQVVLNNNKKQKIKEVQS